MHCFQSMAKYILFFFNFLIVVCGITLIAVGAIIQTNQNNGVDGFSDFSVGGFAVGVGVIIFIIAFYGCYGAYKEDHYMLKIYAGILVVLLILQIILGALVFVAIRNNDGSLDKLIHDLVENVFEEYGTSIAANNTVDVFQQSFECCGVEDPVEWSLTPNSCYEDESNRINQFQTGCREAFQNFIVSNAKIIGGIAIGFAVVELLCAIFAYKVRHH